MMKTETEDETASDIDVTDVEETHNIHSLKSLKDEPCCSSEKRTSSAKSSSDEQSTMRSKINMRERKRMHDLNVAMDSLREVMPYANGPTVRKLSKIATLSLARNYIQMLTKSVEEMKQLLDEIYRNSINTRFQSGGGFHNPLPCRPYSYPLNYGLVRTPNAGAGYQRTHANGQHFYHGHGQGQPHLWDIRNAYAEYNTCDAISNSARQRLAYKHSAREHVGVVSADSSISNHYGSIE